MAKQHYSRANIEDIEATAPPTAYHDDPTASPSIAMAQDETNGPTANHVQKDTNSKPYHDDEGSVFDWGSNDIGSNNNGMDVSDRSDDHKKMKVEVSPKQKRVDDVSFAPLSLEEEDEEDLQHFSRARVNGIRGGQRLHVGGGWGRYGSSNKCYVLRRICFCSHWTLILLASIGLMIGFGFLGYKAGQPAETTSNESRTKGQEWIEWIEHPQEHMNMHWPHFHASNSNHVLVFAPQSQSQLLQTSNLIFHSCNEHSLSTSSGRSACLAACHGRICCFEKEDTYGSCIEEPYSYCYAYAACENALADFRMSNTNNPVNSNSGRLNEQDKILLSDACSSENIQSLEGIRDCNAFCMHHLCCFNGESCGTAEVCADYDACKVLVKNVVKIISGSNGAGGATNNFSGSMTHPSTPTDTANGHDFSYHDPSTIRASVSSACTFDPLANDDSWVPGCHALCADHLCCFGTPGTTSDCRQEKNVMCSAYAGCNVLMYQSNEIDHEEIKSKYEAHRPEMQPGSSTTPDDIREVNEACNNNVLKDSALRSRCEAACSSRKCCFTNGPGNCYILVRHISLILYSC